MTTLPLGKRDPDHDRPALMLAPHLRGAIQSPLQRDWLSQVPSWPMYGNDQWGDCVWAMIGHAILAWTTYAGKPTEVSLEALLKGYSDVTGFNPDDPNTDQGTVLQDALSYWRKTGIAGHKILAYAKLDHNDAAQMQAAINVFGAVLVGIQFPAIAMKQFHAGKPWVVVKRDGGNEGGHAIHVGEYDPSRYELTTWGKVQVMTPEFAAAYVDEAWVAITPEWLTVAGATPDGIDLHGLGEAMAALTGQPNPFPASPTPGPTPAAGLAAALHQDGWVDRVHVGFYAKLAAAGQAWLTSEGL